MKAAARDSAPAVGATPAALEVIHRLEAAHGPLAFFQSGGCCDGTSPICASRTASCRPAPMTCRLGEIGGAPFYIDSEQYERWGTPRFLIDVAPGAAEGFSLEGLEGVHFISRSP